MNGNDPNRQGHRPTATSTNNNKSKDSKSIPRNGCAANEEVHVMLDNLVRFIFGSCASVVEAASGLVPDSWQNGTRSCPPGRKKQRHVDPRLAGLAGRYQSKSINPPESFGVYPSFLEGESVDFSAGEDHTVFDDNISALSAYTLEEMARMNAHAAPRYPGQRSKPAINNAVPPVARISSSSSSSQNDRVHYKFSTKKGILKESFRSSSTRKQKNGAR